MADKAILFDTQRCSACRGWSVRADNAAKVGTPRSLRMSSTHRLRCRLR